MGFEFISRSKSKSRFGIPDAFAIPNAREVGPGKFFGRKAELKALASFCRDRHPLMISITGPAGSGKTTLAKKFAVNQRGPYAIRWVGVDRSPDPENLINQLNISFKAEIESQGKNKEYLVFLDGADSLEPEKLLSLCYTLTTYKPIRKVIFTNREPYRFRDCEDIHLNMLSRMDVTDFVFRLFKDTLSFEQINRLIDVTNTNLLAIKMVSDLIKTKPFDDIIRLFDGSIYELQPRLLSEQSQLIHIVQPQIIIANDTLINKLKQNPHDLFNITSRQFEEVIAELLEGMGMEVELTPATRDGGKDILAYMPTEIGKFLCLVEAKQHNETRPVGVKLVRELYGTLNDYQANSAMLVTTSRFTEPSREFQERHKYQLALKDYTDVVKWISKHKSC